MNGDNCVELFIDVQCAHNASFTKMSYLADSFTNFANESQRDLLKCFTNPFVCDRYSVDQ